MDGAAREDYELEFDSVKPDPAAIPLRDPVGTGPTTEHGARTTGPCSSNADERCARRSFLVVIPGSLLVAVGMSRRAQHRTRRPWPLVPAILMSAIVAAAPLAHGFAPTATRGAIRIQVHQHPDRVAAMDDLVEVGTDAKGAPVFKTESELADSPPTLGCALYARDQRASYATRTTAVLAPDRVFTAPSYSDRDGGTCEFRNVVRGEYAGLVVIERTAKDRDLNMTYSVPRFDVIPDALIPLLPVAFLRWMASVPWLANTLSLLQLAPTEDWAATRRPGAKLEAPVDLSMKPPRPRYDGARFKFDPRRGDLVMHVTLRRLEVTAPVLDLGPEAATHYETPPPIAGLPSAPDADVSSDARAGTGFSSRSIPSVP